jgi:hypothetical protein
MIGRSTIILIAVFATTATAHPSIEVLRVDPVEVMADPDKSLLEACRSWSLSKAQVADFFGLAQEYEISPYASYYQTPCSITGELKSGGEAWSYRINGGATAQWMKGDITRYWGCSKPECEKLVLLPTDFMRGD